MAGRTVVSSVLTHPPPPSSSSSSVITSSLKQQIISCSPSSLHSSLQRWRGAIITTERSLRGAVSASRSRGLLVVGCLPSHSHSSSSSSFSRPKNRLYVSGLSFRTTEESLRNAFERFGQLIEVNLVMDRLANRPRGFAFLRYVTEEEANKAIEGMHGKFLDGRVIFVEVAKPRWELRQDPKQKPVQ